MSATSPAGYQRANERFAETVRPLIEPDDVVWVQDYHMIPLGPELRRLGCRNRIGFFLHIPWPPRRLLTTLPEARQLVESMFAYDVIGFHTEEWLRDVLRLCRRANSARRSTTALFDHRRARRCALIACPIGIDAAEFAELANGPTAQRDLPRDAKKAAMAGR